MGKSTLQINTVKFYFLEKKEVHKRTPHVVLTCVCDKYRAQQSRAFHQPELQHTLHQPVHFLTQGE